MICSLTDGRFSFQHRPPVSHFNKNGRSQIKENDVQLDECSLGARPVFLSLGKQLARLPLDGSPLQLGRADDSPLKFQSRGVSRRHALLRASEGRLEVMDLGSTNGTYVDSKRIRPHNWTALSADQELNLAGAPVAWRRI